MILMTGNKNKIRSKVRIVERSFNGKTEFVIQQRHFLFRFWWVDAWINSDSGAVCQDSFSTYKEAMENLCYFDNSKGTNKIVYET
jgi:hypothetical protein